MLWSIRGKSDRRPGPALGVLFALAAFNLVGVNSAVATYYNGFELRCYDWRDDAPWSEDVHVSEGDDFVINVGWDGHGTNSKMAVEWNTVSRDGEDTAASGSDYEPRDEYRQTKRTSFNMNHTFSTLEDDLYEGDETYLAGYSLATGLDDLDRDKYCVVNIADDDDLRIKRAWFSSTPADGHTYRAGEWIEVAAKFNGRAAVEGNIFVAFLFHSSKGFQSRQVDYRRGSGTDTLVFGYQVDVRDLNVDYEVKPNYIQGDGRLYGVWTDGAHHREDTANRIMPDGYGEQLSVDGRPYVRSVSVTSRPRVGDTYGRGEKVELQVTFDREVVVSGVPVVGLSVGSDYGAARYTSGSGTRVLTFHYEVGEGHTDTDGISIRTSNSAGTHGFVGVGSSITDEEFDVAANRAYSAQSNLSGHKVDGSIKRAPTEPTGLTVERATPLRVLLSWTAPKFDGGTAVTGYKVEWSADGNDPWMVAEADTASTSTSYTHTGRTPQTTYHYRVSAINSVGAGEASESVSATTPALPVATISASVDAGGNPVTAVTEGNDARFTLTFTGDPAELRRVEVGLEVQGDFFAGSESGFQEFNLSPGQLKVDHVTTTTADALDEADGSLTATLFPADGYTVGSPKTATVTILDDDEVPGAIGDLAAAPGDERVILSWSPPMDEGTSPVLGFDYRARKETATNWSNWTDTGVDPGASNPAYTVTNLDNGTPYTFEVRARSAAGKGPPSNRATGTPLPPPVLTSIELTSDAGSDGTYAIGDDIVATVTFDRTLRLDTDNGTPALTLTIGNGTGEAACTLATDTKKLECTYTVAGDDEDTDGVSIGANRLALNGGRIHGIHGATGGDAELAHAALGSDDSHKVDGVRPTLANASVNGIALTLEWSEPLDTGSAPAAGQFVLGVDSGTAPTVSSLTMSGTTMTLTLASAADATRDYTLAYTVPSSNPVKDLAGNEAVAFTGTGIETVQITWSFTLTSPRSDGAGNPLVVEGGATATATVSIANAVTTTVAQTVKLQWDGSDIGGDGEPGRLLTIAGVVGPTITVPAGEASASAVIGVREDALYAPTHTAAFTATHLGTEIGSVDLTLTDDDAPPVMTIAVSASPAASDTRMSAITINEGEGFHLEITLDRGFATFQPPLGSAVTVTAPSGTFNAGDLASLPPSFARDIKTFATTIHSSDNTAAAGAVDAVFTVAPDVDGRYTAGTPVSATVRILDNDAVPTRPRNLTARDDDREVALRWQLPASYGDIELTGYQYRVRARGGAWSPDWTRIPHSVATTTSHTVTGLTNNTRYTFEVRGINSKGGGPAARVEGRPLDVGIRVTNHSVAEGESTTLRIRPPGAPFDAGAEKVLTIVLASRGGEDRARAGTDYILRRGTTPLAHSDRAFDVLTLSGAQPHFTLPMPPSLQEVTLTLETIEDELAECREELFAYAWIHDAADPGNRSRIDADLRRSDNIFIEDDDPHAKLESAQIDGATVTLTFDRAIDQIEVAGPGDPDHDPGYLPLLPRSYFTMWRGGGTAPAWAGASGVPLNVAWRSKGPGPAAGTGASSFVLTARTVTLTFPEPIAEGENAWLAYQRSGRHAPLGKATEGRCRRAVPKFITALTNVTGTAGGTTPPTILIADAEGFERAEASVDFTVTLDRASTDTVTVDYRTSPGTATEGADYTATSGTVTFAPGDTAKTISVPIVDDDVEDSGETFTVTLSNPAGATLGNHTATGTIHNNDDGSETPGDALTASFEGVPEAHGGPGSEAFTFRVRFNLEPRVSYKVLRDESFAVTGGEVRKARRVDGRNDLREIHVEPEGWDDVRVMLAGGRACGTRGAICTADNKVLANTAVATVQGPLALSVADAEAQEGPGVTLDFEVTLNRAASGTVTVDYATADGTATAGADYTAASGMLTFAPGETAKTVNVPVLDDAHDDTGETLTLTLSNATGARIRDGEATGTIENSDPIPQAWLARFGRTVADHVVDAVTERLTGSSGGGSQVTLGGQPIPLDGVLNGASARTSPGGSAGGDTRESAAAADTLAAFADRISGDGAGGERGTAWARWGEGGGEDAAARRETRGLTERELLLGSSFLLSLGGAEANGTGTAWTAWGRAAASRFDGEADGLSLDGDVTTFTFGADAARGRWLGGVALAHSTGEGGYRDHEAREGHPARGSGTLQSSLTSVHPYARLAVSERLSLWGILGYGAGDLTLAVDAAGIRPRQSWKTDTEMWMAAAGARGVLLSAADHDGFELAARGDARLVRMNSDAATGADGAGRLSESESQTSRLRFILEGSHRIEMAGGQTLTPSLEVGLRHDGGDAETGTGIELGGGVSYADPTTGITVEAKARGLLAHEDADYTEWGASGSVKIDPGAAGRGLSLSLSPAWGADSGNAERLWGLADARGLAGNDGVEPAGRLDAEAGWGFGAFGGRGLATPFAGLSLSDAGERTWRSGVRWTLGRDLAFGVEGRLREAANDNAGEHGVMLEIRARW